MNHELIVNGRIVGTSTGWDQHDTFAFAFYGVVAAPGYTGPVGDIAVDYESGLIKSYDDDGNILQSIDLIDALKDLERKQVAA